MYESQSSESSGVLGRKSLPSQLSQSSLHSATDVMDIDDYSSALADDSIFTIETSEQNSESKPPSTQVIWRIKLSFVLQKRLMKNNFDELYTITFDFLLININVVVSK